MVLPTDPCFTDTVPSSFTVTLLEHMDSKGPEVQASGSGRIYVLKLKSPFITDEQKLKIRNTNRKRHFCQLFPYLYYLAAESIPPLQIVFNF